MGTDAALWTLFGFVAGVAYMIVLAWLVPRRRWQNLEVEIDEDGVVQLLVVDGEVLIERDRNDRAETHKEDA